MSQQFQHKLNEVNELITSACNKAGRECNEITIIAVSKKHPIEKIREALAAGHIDFGENRIPEAVEKSVALKETPARIHFIGQLQSNKVNKAVGVFESIASVDRLSLLKKIQQRASEMNIAQNIWLQVNVTAEDQKGGADLEEAKLLWEEARLSPNLHALGLMGMGRRGDSEKACRDDFARLRNFAENLTPDGDDKSLLLNMGMSGDYAWAIAEGATHIRLGTVLFGQRP